MNRTNNTNGSDQGLSERVANTNRIIGWLGTVAVVAMVLLVVGSISVGSVGASAQSGQSGNTTQSGETFAVKQGDNCYTVTPLGNETDNVVSFYDYQGAEQGYSSRGTMGLQVEDTSQFFFYKGNAGLSLVMLHDKYTNDTSSGGGAVTLEMQGLPATGGWAIKDDGYPGANDTFTRNESSATASWSWEGGRADGGVYQATPSAWDTKVKIVPHFNQEAANYPDSSWGGGNTSHQVQRWIVRSGNGTAHALNLSEEVTIERGTCANVGGNTQNTSTANGSGGASTGQGDTDAGAEMTTSGDESGGTVATGPGFGIVLTMLALAVALIAILRRR